MKRLLIVTLLLAVFTIAIPTSAQSVTLLECGRHVEAAISNNNETHTYTISLEQNSRLLVEAGVLAGDQAGDLTIDIGVAAPDGTTLEALWSGHASLWHQYYRQEPFFVSGTFTITLQGYIQFGGNYWLQVDCVEADGDATGSLGRLYTVSCGDLISNTFGWHGDTHYYYIQLERDGFFTASAEVTETLRQPTLEIGFLSPRNEAIDPLWSGHANEVRAVQNQLLNSTGLHTIVVQGYGTGGGDYSLAIGCTQDGQEILAGSGEQITITRGEYYAFENGVLFGDGSEESDDEDESEPAVTEQEPVQDFSIFGFSGLNPVDFSEGIELPLVLGQAQVAPVAGDLVALYTYEASEGQVATLNLSRVSGDISIGVAVINKDTNELIFMGGMPSSDNLSVGLTFPSAGMYAIGLFALDTPERSETSGAVEIMLE